MSAVRISDLQTRENVRRFFVYTRGGSLDLSERPLIMGILNATPDSFSDGGLRCSTREAVEHGLRMEADGASIIDIGGQSTRPGSQPVDEDEELRRVLPIFRELSGKTKALLSIDTSKAAVAREAIAAGAVIVNDTSAMADDPKMADVVRETGCAVVLVHRRGTPETMQSQPHYESLFGELTRELSARIEFAVECGIGREQILVDPGIGFGKRLEDNLDLHRNLDRLAVLGRPIVFGSSRKSFIGTLTGRQPKDRTFGTAASVAIAVMKGARVLRVHDVKEMREVIQVATAIRGELE